MDQRVLNVEVQTRSIQLCLNYSLKMNFSVSFLLKHQGDNKDQKPGESKQDSIQGQTQIQVRL